MPPFWLFINLHFFSRITVNDITHLADCQTSMSRIFSYDLLVNMFKSRLILGKQSPKIVFLPEIYFPLHRKFGIPTRGTSLFSYILSFIKLLQLDYLWISKELNCFCLLRSHVSQVRHASPSWRIPWHAACTPSDFNEYLNRSHASLHCDISDILTHYFAAQPSLYHVTLVKMTLFFSFTEQACFHSKNISSLQIMKIVIRVKEYKNQRKISGFDFSQMVTSLLLITVQDIQRLAA